MFLQTQNGLGYAVCCRGVVRLPSSDAWPLLPQKLDFSQHTLPVRFSEGANFSLCNTDFEVKDWASYAYIVFLPQAAQEALYQCQFDEHEAMLALVFNEAAVCPAACRGEPYHDDARLVVHVRSGDIFTDDGTNPLTGVVGYIQYPASFYAAILSHRTWTHVLFVTESCESLACFNPVYLHFQKLEVQAAWPHTVFEFRSNGTLDEDVATYRCAMNFVPAHSSLSYYVIATSHVLRSFFIPFGARCMAYGGRCGVPRPGVHQVSIRLGSEWKLNSKWKNSREQRERMITYAFEVTNTTFVYDKERSRLSTHTAVPTNESLALVD